MEENPFAQLLTCLGDNASFSGRADEARVIEIKNMLGVALPESYKRYLQELGNGDICGMEIFGSGLGKTPACVGATRKFRENDLPMNLVVVQDESDCLFCLDTSRFEKGECPVVIVDLINESVEDGYENFEDFFRARLEDGILLLQHEAFEGGTLEQQDKTHQEVMRNLQEMKSNPQPGSSELISSLRSLGPDGIQVLIEFLSHSNAVIRGHAAWVLLLLNAQTYLPHILPLLADPVPYVRQMLIEKLHDFGDERAVEAVCQMAFNDPESHLRYLAYVELGKIGTGGIIPVLERAVLSEQGMNAEGIPVKAMAKTAIRQIRARHNK